MQDLIARVRDTINDPTTSGTFPNDTGGVFSNQQVQDVLDRYRWDVRGFDFMLVPKFSNASDGTYQWLDYYATGFGDWESDAVLKFAGLTPVTPATSDYQRGHWTFTTSQLPPLYVTGQTYDIFAACATLLRRWASKEMLSFDFQTEQEQFSRNQKVTELRRQAEEFARQARPVSITMLRSDDVPAYSPPPIGVQS